jgi:nitroimidazol reductase NimA-like FMN-containing flavoprotein (pyridoxamine 5'-phosphate oxidase superfamily)
MDYEKAATYWIEKDKGSVKMDADALRQKITAFIYKHNTCALAVAAGDFVRCTPIEYNYVDDSFYLFSEGGLKFKALKDNKNVCLAIYEEYQGFGKLNGLQVTGTAEIVEPWSEEYLKLLAFKKIPETAMRRLPEPMNLIKIVPAAMEFLCSDLKNEGYGSRQHLDIGPTAIT